MAGTQAVYYRDKRGDEPVNELVLYQRSGNLIVLLHAIEKNTGAVPAVEKTLAKQRMADFKQRMDARARKRPRAVGRDAPPRGRK